jgi:PPOX class probable F420-dependent enzyme
MVLPASAREVLLSGALAHFVTINPDGSPQVSCVWVGLDSDEIVSAHLHLSQRKLQNIARDPRVVLSIEASDANAIGMRHYLVVRGIARITEGGAPELLQQLAHTYIGPDAVFPPMADPPSGAIVHIEPRSVGGIGPWADGT